MGGLLGPPTHFSQPLAGGDCVKLVRIARAHVDFTEYGEPDLQEDIAEYLAWQPSIILATSVELS